MFQYKALASNYPPDRQDLDRYAQENWEFVGVCTILPETNLDEIVPNKPASMIEAGEKVRYVYYFKRMVE